MDDKVNKSRSILYLGSDQRYRERIIERFKSSYGAVEWTFPLINIDDVDPKIGIQSLFIKVLEENPRIIYFDFSEGENNELFFLAELVSRDNFFKDIPLCGLVDKKERVESCLSTGVDLNFIKGMELFDVINTPMTIAFPKVVKPANFAKAQVSTSAKLVDDFRVGYMTDSLVHIESNFPINENEIITLETSIPFKTVPSKNFKVKRKSSEDLYYDFGFSYDLLYEFVDPPDLTEVEDRGESMKLQKEHIARIDWCKKKHKEWIDYNVDDTSQKNTKILIIDNKMRVLCEPGTGDIRRLPFGFRFQTELDEEMNSINTVRPLLIAYQMFSKYGPELQETLLKAVELFQKPEEDWNLNDIAADEDEKNFNSMMKELKEYIDTERSFVGALMNKIKSMTDYNPVVILYGAHFDTAKSLQESYQYSLVTTQANSINMSSIVKVSTSFAKKRKAKFDKLIADKIAVLKKSDPQKFRKLSPSNFSESRYYIKKSNSLSYGTIEVDITVKAMTESELLFSTSLELPHKTYRMHSPVEMSIHLVRIDGKDYDGSENEKIYRALIHSISEEDKRKLREHVNKVFFAPLMEQREQELADFKKKNSDIQLQREEAKAEALAQKAESAKKLEEDS
jgi:hypothetical protein